MTQILNLDPDLFFLGESIETQYGTIRYLKFIEYIRFIKELNFISMTPLHLYYMYKKMLVGLPVEDQIEANKTLAVLKNQSLFEFISEEQAAAENYIKILKIVLDEKDHKFIVDILSNEKVFISMRKLIMEMNYVTEDPISENPEIQEYYEDRKRLKQREAGKQSISAIVTSIVAGTSNSFDDVKNMTVIQLYSIYYRLGAFKNFDTSVLFATVSKEVKIEPWSANIDMFAKEELGINYNEFNKKYGGLFG